MDEGCQDETVTAAGQYLDGSTFNADTYTAIIACTGTDPITCVNNSITPAGGEIIVNSAVTTGLEGALIKCTAPAAAQRRSDPASPVTCTKESGDSNGYYMNSGSDKDTNLLIKCTDKCVSAVAEATTGYYLDYGSKDVINSQN
ncbi:hypothetical protein LY90DRAFT_47181 [Neocallimastix californiae]|uniref:Uncharacterized protein n=1 Tax=Neocallimastix californiae TaxID=1754190 RepID=A0A1Y1XC87_9FUNG|nr:hypothetical protein LY90DRAFT_47181 [Neocallimastix californiae]|eukprot:ORX83348.1 hypothetical protein LY90DRAFT_47181 [Neocallimastix californiae]